MAEIGTILDNKYEILTEIGRGGMSVVYLAMDRRLNRQWAVKEVRKRTNDKNNEIVVTSLQAEANLMKALDHPRIPRIVDIIEDDSTIYVVMDYMSGKSLDKVLKENKRPLSQEAVINIGIQLCEALGYLHGQNPPIIYRDMKPANIMLKNPDNNDPSKISVMLFDFGIAREYKEDKTGDTKLMGTPGFAAPEQCRWGKQTDVRSDIYSLGVTLYNLVTGHSPAQDNKLYPIRHWNDRLSAGLEQIILKCTAAEPEERYQSCEELKYALENYELYDDEVRGGLRRTLNLCLVPAILSVVFLLTGFVCHGLYNRENTANYDVALDQGEKYSDAQYYIEAIGYDAADVRAYEGLIKLFKQDVVFDTDERALLMQQMEGNLDVIKSRDTAAYVQLCYDTGSLYWFYYNYGGAENNQTTRMVNALPWFQDVQTTCEEYDLEFDKLNVADIFCDIATFYRDYSNNVREAADQGTYKEFWDTLEELRSYLEDSSEQELVQWESYKVIVYALENLLPKFVSDGVGRAEVVSMVESIKADIETMPATTDTTQEIKDYINQRISEDGAIERGITANFGS